MTTLEDLIRRQSIPDWLREQIQTTLSSDSNDGEHDALVAVAEYFRIDWTAFEHPND